MSNVKLKSVAAIVNASVWKQTYGLEEYAIPGWRVWCWKGRCRCPWSVEATTDEARAIKDEYPAAKWRFKTRQEAMKTVEEAVEAHEIEEAERLRAIEILDSLRDTDDCVQELRGTT
jgi:hypothetical protein